MKSWFLTAGVVGGLWLALASTGGLKSWILADEGDAEHASKSRTHEEQLASLKQSIFEECEFIYRDATVEELEIELAAFREAIREDSEPYFAAQFAAGAFEVEGHFEPGEPYGVQPTGEEICARRMMKDGVVGKVVCPPRDFPEAYDLMYRAQWLQSHKLNRSLFSAIPE